MENTVKNSTFDNRAKKMKDIKFIKRNESSLSIKKNSQVTIHVDYRIVRFSFRNDLAKEISKTGYAIASDVDESSDVLYFRCSDENEGHKLSINKNSGSCFMTIGVHEYAKKIEELDWEGIYQNYYCEGNAFYIKLKDKQLPKDDYIVRKITLKKHRE